MKSFFQSYLHRVKHILGHTNPRERTFLVALAILIVIGTLGTIWTLNQRFSHDVPVDGGSIREGVIGTPRFINPVLASSDVDRDMTALVYSGLMRRGDTHDLINDLAESYTISPDGKVYTFTLRPNLKFHDGKQLTSDDVLFTIEKIQNGTLKSPLRINWIDVEVTAPDEQTIVFNLKQPYAGFLLATTVGILPKHIWGSMSDDEFEFSDYNTKPIGSGPYKVVDINGSKDSAPTAYTFRRFKKFALGAPYIHKITMNLYPNEQELLGGFEHHQIDNIHAFRTSYARSIKRNDSIVIDEPLPRVFALFFNHSKNKIFLEKNVVTAMNMALDRTSIIESVLDGFGSPLQGPIPSMFTGELPGASSPDIERAKAILENAGWKVNPETGIRERTSKSGKETLSFSISTASSPDLEETARMISEQLAQIGMGVEIRLFEIGNLDRDVIRPREYDTLLFGQVLRHDTDLYAFWHSSQRNDPGLNVALYTNARVDTLLEKALVTNNTDERIDIYKEVESKISSDYPALFLYSPHMLFTFDKSIQGYDPLSVVSPHERFAHVYNWYVRTDRIWNFID
ncbi:MAG: hypothetical protein KBC98_00810 [Candidatus Pacebacteria bacterium]|nr:hypothetical protein [Candidatus Paceibacterota bacterium]